MKNLFIQAREALKRTQIWRSIFRVGYPDNIRTQVLTVTGHLILHLHPSRVKKSSLALTYTFCLGGLSFFLFFLLTITGVLLMFYYRPTTEWAYWDMKDLEFAVTLGKYLRNMHRWTAHAIVITVILHMARVFYTGSYKPP